MHMGKLSFSAFILLSLACCGTSGGGDVWEDYDYTDHEPYYYQQTEDNDDTYEIPSGFGICNDGSGMNFGCE